MADETLQAFQLGASLYDRAQTQRRMMEQFQLQAADQVMRQRQADLQNQIQSKALSDALEESGAQQAEFGAFSQLGKDVSDYLNNPKPDAKFPVVPAFKSRQFRIEADRMLNNLEKYSARAELVKSKARAEAKADQLSAAQYRIAAEYGAFKFNPQTGQQDIDYDLVNRIAAQKQKAALAETESKTTSRLGNLEVAKNNLIRLQQEGKDKSAIERAKMEYRKALDRERLDLEGEKVDILRERTDIEREKAGKVAAVKPTKLDLDELEFSEAVLNGIKPLEPYLDQDLYGPTFNVRVKAGETFGTYSPEREANQVYSNLKSGALFKRGGKALTKTEIGVITSNIGNPTDQGFADRVRTYKVLHAKTLKDRIDKLRTQGIADNPQYSGYLADLEKKANEVLGVEEEASPQRRSFNTIEEAEAANLDDGTPITVGGRNAIYRK